MPPKKRFKCDRCPHSFSTFVGLCTHRGMMHSEVHGAGIGGMWMGKPRPPPPAPIPPMEAMEDLDEDLPALEDDEDDEAGQEADAAVPEAEDPVAEARAYARRMLRDPSWVQWAEDTLHWCEDNLLGDVAALFPAAQDFPTEETYRFLRLFHEHPGASFASELLRANSEQPLDLSKVGMCCAFVAHFLVEVI